MPFTYLSHQAPAIGLKLLRPRWFDGTALVIGSMAPDFAYALAGTPLELNGHDPVGLLLFCVPVTMVVCWVVRARVAAVAFAQMPDTPLRLHDYRVLATRRPPIALTALSALLGGITHAFWDTFTHDGRWGASNVGFLQHTAFDLGDTTVSVARSAQYIGHVGGAAVTIGLLWWIARRGLLAQWYGEAYDALPTVALRPVQRVAFWAITALGLAIGVAWALAGTGGYATSIIRASLGLAAGVTVACLLPPTQPATDRLDTVRSSIGQP